MSVKVNLLPREAAGVRAARRVTGFTIVAVVLFVAVLGLLYMAKLNEITQAEEEREVVQADISRLQAEIAQLEQFRQLANEFEARNALLAAAMSSEISMARVLNDLSLAFPATSSLRSMQMTAADPTAGTTEGEVEFGRAAGTATYDGYSTERYAPGVETVLIEFDKVTTFFNTFMATAALEEIGTTEVTSFQGSLQLNEEAYTRRYEDGLPEEAAR